MSMFISCDWGTSAFRLRLLEGRDVLAAFSTDAGIAAVHTDWQASGLPPAGRVAFYREVLEKAIGGLARGAQASGASQSGSQGVEARDAGGQQSGERGLDLHGVPVIISGMASSSIGMLELPYRPLPFDASGADLRPTALPPTDASPRTLYLLPGVRSADDVMRGEETQLIGCGINPPGERVFVFPGTHSKHVIVRNSRAVDFKTYMTGELFDLFTRHSILAGSVAAADLVGADPVGAGPAMPRAAGLPAAFFAGVAAARESGLLHNAFLARTNHLFNKYSKEDNYHFLSGLLIGEELVELAGKFRPITLVASSPLREAYAAALAYLGVGQPTVIEAEQALLAGHCAIIARFGATIAPGTST